MFPKSNKTLTIYDIINNNLKPKHLFSKNKECSSEEAQKDIVAFKFVCVFIIKNCDKSSSK